MITKMSKEIEFLENMIIPTDKFGDLLISAVIINYDYPRIFIAANKDKTRLFAFMENDASENNFGWNITEITLKDVYNVNSGRANIQSLFIGKEYCYLSKYDPKTNSNILERVKQFDGENRIDGNLFAEDFCDMDFSFDYHNLQSNSIKSKNCSLSIIEENDSYTTTKNVFSIAEKLRSFCKTIKNGFDIFNSKLMVQNKSTAITFVFDTTTKGTLLEGVEAADIREDGLVKLINILNSDDSTNLLVDMPKKKKLFLKKYNSLINAISKESLGKPKIVMSLPKKSKPISFAYNREYIKRKKIMVKQTKKKIKSETVTKTSPVEIEGVLKGVYAQSPNTFAILDIHTNKVYSGTLDADLLGQQFIVNGLIYKATITKIEEIQNGDIIDIKYKLSNLKETDKRVENAKQLHF